MKNLKYVANALFAAMIILSVLLGALLWVGVTVIAYYPDILAVVKPIATLAVCFLLSGFFVVSILWYIHKQQQNYEK
jgi:hypothetical protein